MSYTGAVPAHERAIDWRDRGLCGRPGERAEDWFPVGSQPDAIAAANHAKAVCWRCPVMQTCLQSALDNRESAGIWGGLDEHERLKILRRRGVNLPDIDIEPDPPRTLRTIWDARAAATADGHCGWKGGRPVFFRGRAYTPQQIAFIVSRGREPVGLVRKTCSHNDCILPAHLADQEEREARSRVTEAAS
jgi:WhiB family redox-sensing transcriptional regulator